MQLAPEVEEKKRTAEEVRLNAARESALLDGFQAALLKEAKSAGTTIAGLSELPEEQARGAFGRAQREAISSFATRSFPGLAQFEELPNRIFTKEGKEIPVRGEKSGIEADITINDLDSEIHKLPDGRSARVLSKGKTVVKMEIMTPDGQLLQEVFYDVNGNPHVGRLPKGTKGAGR